MSLITVLTHLSRALLAVGAVADKNDVVSLSSSLFPVIFLQKTSWGWSLSHKPRQYCRWHVRVLKDSHQGHLPRDQTLLFSSQYIHISSPDPYFKDTFALSAELATELGKYAHTLTKRVLSNQETQLVDNNISSRRRNTVCAAFWKAGQLRGSMMASGETLKQAVYNALTRTLLNDERWKPLSLADLDQLVIEITIFSPVKMPIKAKEERTLDYTKGYIATMNDRLGLYVPEVFNAQKFNDPAYFFYTLVTQKGGIPEDKLKATNLFKFDVCDVVSLPESDQVLMLDATMPVKDALLKLSISSLSKSASQAVDWLLSIQEADGNFFKSVKVPRSHFGEMDWARMPLALYALVEWNNNYPSEVLTQAVNKGILFCLPHLFPKSGQAYWSDNKIIGAIYLGHTYCALSQCEEAKAIVEKILKYTQKRQLATFTQLQLYSLLERVVQLTKDYSYQIIRRQSLSQSCKKSFYDSKDNPYTESAFWPEAVVAYTFSDPEFAEEVTTWLFEHQKPDGSFMLSRQNDLSYTRGTGKIIEVLAPQIERHFYPLQQACQWMFAMQYTSENLFFVEPELRPQLVGAFRHDMNNPDAWIDSAEHFILAASRMITALKKSGKQ